MGGRDEDGIDGGMAGRVATVVPHNRLMVSVFNVEIGKSYVA